MNCRTMSTKYRVLALLLALLVTLLLLTTAAAAVGEQDTAAEPESTALIATAEPSADGVTYSALLTALYHHAGDPDVTVPEDGEEADPAYAAALAWALEQGILTGEADQYPAEQAITREQFAVALYHYAAALGKDTTQKRELSAYEDADEISDDAREALSWAHATNLVNRTGLHTISPQGAVTAEQLDAAIKTIDTIKDQSSANAGAGKASFLQKLKAEFVMNFITQDRWKFYTTGLLNTLKITFVSTLLGIALGAIIAIIRSTWDKNQESMRRGLGRTLLGIGNAICKVYLTVIRGTPVLVQLMIIYFIIFANASDGVPVAMLAFGMNSAAYVAEIIRSGIMSTDNGQFEAGRSLGFNYVQTMWYIVIPQALRAVLPALANEFIVLLKETSVAGYVGIRDLTKGGDLVRGVTMSAFMPLIAVAIIYLIMVMFFTWLVGKLERRLRNDER